MAIQQMLLGAGGSTAVVTNYSVDFAGNNYLSVASSQDLRFGLGDFSIEFWVNPDNFTYRGTFYDSRPSDGNTGITIGHESSSGEIRVYMIAADGGDIIVQSSDFNTNVWKHIAVTRDSGTVRLFINGLLKDTETSTSRNLTNTTANIGYKSYTTSGYTYFDGKISNLRVVKGSPVYTSAFTPSNTALTNITNTKLLCCNKDTVTGKDVGPTITSSGNPSSSTDTPFPFEPAYSCQFDGYNDKVSIPDTADFEFGSGDFTIEAWVKQTNTAGSGASSHTIVNKWHNTSNAKEWILRIDNGTGSNVLQWLQTTNGSSNQFTTGNTTINTGSWYHVAVVGHSGTIKLFVNGTQQSATGTQGTIHSYSNELIFGYNKSSNSQWMDGKISNCRITKGQALYTSSFTVPTEALTLTSQSATAENVKLLCLNKNTVTGSTKTPGTITNDGATAAADAPF